MTDSNVLKLSTDDLAGIRSTERPSQGNVIYIYLRAHQGIAAYRGTDRSTVMGIVEVDGVYYRVIVSVKLSERWIFDTRDEGRASRHIARLAQRAYDSSPLAAA